MVSKPREWLSTNQGRWGMGLIGLLIAYALATRAIDTGSYWQYLGAFIFVVLSINLLIKAIRNGHQ